MVERTYSALVKLSLKVSVVSVELACDGEYSTLCTSMQCSMRKQMSVTPESEQTYSKIFMNLFFVKASKTTKHNTCKCVCTDH